MHTQTSPVRCIVAASMMTRPEEPHKSFSHIFHTLSRASNIQLRRVARLTVPSPSTECSKSPKRFFHSSEKEVACRCVAKAGCLSRSKPLGVAQLHQTHHVRAQRRFQALDACSRLCALSALKLATTTLISLFQRKKETSSLPVLASLAPAGQSSVSQSSLPLLAV